MQQQQFATLNKIATDLTKVFTTMQNIRNAEFDDQGLSDQIQLFAAWGPILTHMMSLNKTVSTQLVAQVAVDPEFPRARLDLMKRTAKAMTTRIEEVNEDLVTWFSVRDKDQREMIQTYINERNAKKIKEAQATRKARASGSK